MIKIFPDSDEVFIRSKSRTSSTNMMKYGEEKQKLYENYLIEITKTNKFYSEPLMIFLNINTVKRLALISNKNNLLKK